MSPMKARRSCNSSGVLNIIFLFSFTSTTSKTKPSCILESITSPVVVNGSAYILASGKLKAEGSVLSANNAMIGSDGLSSKVISAAPGPKPRMLPEKASLSKS